MNIVMRTLAAAAFALSATSSWAATLTVLGSDPFGTVHCESCSYLSSTDASYYVDTTGSYSGGFTWVSASADVDDLWTINPGANSEQNEVAAFNTITGGTMDYTLFRKDESGTFYDSSNPYESLIGQLLIFKFGYGQNGSHLFVWNDAGSEIYYTGSRLSHVTIGEVPLPAAGFLLLGGLGTLAVMRRRRKA